MKKNSYTYVKNFRQNVKKICVLALGGCCQLCGYDRCTAALEMHHIDPKQKDIIISRITSWEQLYEELPKAILVCSNCHREIHHNGRKLPDNYVKFDIAFADSLRELSSIKRERGIKTTVDVEYRKELILNSGVDTQVVGWIAKVAKIISLSSVQTSNWIKSNMPDFYKTCLDHKDYLALTKQAKNSRKLDNATRKVNRKLDVKRRIESLQTTPDKKLYLGKVRKFNPSKEELEILVWQMPTTKVAKHFGVSDRAIAKRCDLLGIVKPERGYWNKIYAAENNV